MKFALRAMKVSSDHSQVRTRDRMGASILDLVDCDEVADVIESADKLKSGGTVKTHLLRRREDTSVQKVNSFPRPPSLKTAATKSEEQRSINVQITTRAEVTESRRQEVPNAGPEEGNRQTHREVDTHLQDGQAWNMPSAPIPVQDTQQPSFKHSSPTS